MSLRSIGFVGILCLMAVGCDTKSTLSEAQWRAQLARQQAVAREFGRIGYIGYQGPAVGTTGAGVGTSGAGVHP